MKPKFDRSSFDKLFEESFEYIRDAINKDNVMDGEIPALLNYAVLKNRFDVVTYIVEEDLSKLLIPTYSQPSLLLQVCISGNIVIFDYLKSRNVFSELSKWDVLGNITNYSENDSHLEMVKYVLQDNYNVSAFDESGLNHAVLKYNPKTVKYLVDNGADITNNNYLPYMYAATSNNMKMFKFLEDNYGEIEPNINSALAEAATFSNDELIKHLIDKGWNLDGKNSEKCDPDILSKEKLKEVRTYTEYVRLKKELEKELSINENTSKKAKI